MSIRKSFVSGVFYPDSCEEVLHYIRYFNTNLPQELPSATPYALIVPHAGYIYSGHTANIAYALASKRKNIKRVIVIGPSHKVALRGASIALFDTYQTPCAKLAIDLELSTALEQKYDFLNFTPSAHEEHSTEVQMPFIEYHLPEAKVLEIVYGEIDASLLSSLIDALLIDPDNLIVISSDLSHFHSLEEAKRLDDCCVQAIKKMEPLGFSDCEACGLTGIKALVQSAQKRALRAHFLDYRTSFERTKDATRVVGYCSFIFGE